MFSKETLDRFHVCRALLGTVILSGAESSRSELSADRGPHRARLWRDGVEESKDPYSVGGAWAAQGNSSRVFRSWYHNGGFGLIVAFAGILTVVASSAQQPPVKVNVLNVCTPSADDQKELSSALAKVPAQPAFGKDYEVARGHSTLDANTPVPGMQPLPAGAVSAADWVRVRREFPEAALFSNAQYSFSVDASNMVETLVLRVRDPKDVMEVSLEDSASAVTSAAAMLSANTPVSRVKLERFGKSSVVLARCTGTAESPAPDQNAYEPIFREASAILKRYRDALGVRKTVPQELGRMGVGNSAKASGPRKKP